MENTEIIRGLQAIVGDEDRPPVKLTWMTTKT